MATSRATCPTATAMDEIPTVMVVGKCGMGKSTLCNNLLYGVSRPKGGFLAAGGTDPVTAKCETKHVAGTGAPRSMDGAPDGGPLRAIDTPGIPDPRARTLEFYNNIVETARGAGGLNALIIKVLCGRDRQHIQDDFETNRIILKQFDRLPCLKILLCRLRIEHGLTDEQQEEEMKDARDWASTIMEKGGLRRVKFVLLLDNSSQDTQIFTVRHVVCAAPKVPILECNIRTHVELTESAKKLVDLERRAKELKVEKSRLECERAQLVALNHVFAAKSTEARERGDLACKAMFAFGICTDFLFLLSSLGVFTAVGAVSGAKKAYEEHASRWDGGIDDNNNTCNEIDAKVHEINNEELNGPDKQVLQRDVDTLAELEKVAA